MGSKLHEKTVSRITADQRAKTLEHLVQRVEMWDDTKTIPSTDQNVSKYVFAKGDAVAEAVLYKYPTYADRTVICCSTQSGCPVGCRFCGAGDYFVRSLTAEEIVSQPVKLIKDTGIQASGMKRLQIMFMSMGEPLLNKELAPAIRMLYELYPNAALLISTSAPAVDYEWVMKLSEEVPTVGLLNRVTKDLHVLPTYLLLLIVFKI